MESKFAQKVQKISPNEYCWVDVQEAAQLPLIFGGWEALQHFLGLRQANKLLQQEFYFIRHGETDVNANPGLLRQNYDLPLNERGVQRAARAKEVVAKLPIKLTHCSPIQRAVYRNEFKIWPRPRKLSKLSFFGGQ